MDEIVGNVALSDTVAKVNVYT